MRTRAWRTAILVMAAVAANFVVSEPAASAGPEPADTGPVAAALELQPGLNLQATLRNVASGQCLAAFSSQAGAPVWLSDCGSGDGWHVRWEIEWVTSNAVQLRKPGTNVCLVTPTWADGLGVLYYCGYSDQWWDPDEVSPFVYHGRNVAHPEWCLVGPNWSGGRAAWWQCNRDYTDQLWTLY